MRRFISAILIASASSVALANLNNGDIVYNPALAVPPGPTYTVGTPAWLNAGGLLASLSGAISNDFTGVVDSYVYALNGVDGSGGLGFVYRISLAAGSNSGLVRGSLAPTGWAPVTIADAGSNESGASTQVGGSGWTDGDPYFIERDFTTSAPAWQFRVGALGTRLDAGNSSALVWFETDATVWQRSEIDLLDSGLSGESPVLAPIPAPAAIGLGAFGLALLGHNRRKLS